MYKNMKASSLFFKFSLAVLVACFGLLDAHRISSQHDGTLATQADKSSAVTDVVKDGIRDAGSAIADSATELAQQGSEKAQEIFWGLSTGWKIAALAGVVLLLGGIVCCVFSFLRSIFWCVLPCALIGLGVFIYFEWFYVMTPPL